MAIESTSVASLLPTYMDVLITMFYTHTQTQLRCLSDTKAAKAEFQKLSLCTMQNCRSTPPTSNCEAGFGTPLNPKPQTLIP